MAAISAWACGQENKSTLVLYYSQNGNTKAVAEEIASFLKADIEEIVPLAPYDGDFQATIARCLEEKEAGVLPEIQELKSKIEKYDVIYLGFPVWFGTYAPPVATLLKQIDLSGKTVVPFCTFGSGGLDSSTRALKEAQPGAVVKDGFGIRAARMDALQKELGRFLSQETPEAFPQQHDVNAEETAIFDAATAGYPMLSAEAVTVASRLVPDGIEYLFGAVDKGRGTSMIQVYVLVEEGRDPVFTQVCRE